MDNALFKSYVNRLSDGSEKMESVVKTICEAFDVLHESSVVNPEDMTDEEVDERYDMAVAELAAIANKNLQNPFA